jgi:hypothetical protein
VARKASTPNVLWEWRQVYRRLAHSAKHAPLSISHFRLARLPTEPNSSFHTSRHTCATPALEALSDSYIPLHTLRTAKCDLSASLLLESVIGCSLSARFVSCVRLIQRERKKALTYSPSLYSTIAPPTQYSSLCFFCSLSLPLSVVHCSHHLSISQSILSQSPSPDTAPTVYQSTAYRHAPPHTHTSGNHHIYEKFLILPLMQASLRLGLI